MKSIAVFFLVGFLLLGSVAFNEAYSLQQVSGTPTVRLNPGETATFQWYLVSDDDTYLTVVNIRAEGAGSEFLSFPEVVEINPRKSVPIEFIVSIPEDYPTDIKLTPDIFAVQEGPKGGATIFNIQMKKTIAIIIGSPDPEKAEERDIPRETPQVIQEETSAEETVVEETSTPEDIPAPVEEKAPLRPDLDLPSQELQIIQESEEKGGGCLIATAAYGSELAQQVQLLREIRDNTLLSTTSGSTFMIGFNQLYYTFSPTIADLERENAMFKEVVKAFITPMISTLSIMTLADEGSESQVLGFGISVIALNLGMYIAAPIAIAFKIKNIRT